MIRYETHHTIQPLQLLIRQKLAQCERFDCRLLSPPIRLVDQRLIGITSMILTDNMPKVLFVATFVWA